MLCTEGRLCLQILEFFFLASIPAWFVFAETNLELCPTAQRITTVYVLIGA